MEHGTNFNVVGVTIETAEFRSLDAVRVSMPSESYQDIRTEKLTDRPLMAWLPEDFGDGTIEVDVASVLASDAPEYARGFIGIAFRIVDGPRFEGLYLRPVNSRVDDQVRRNHTTQYFSYPDYDFARLRAESPEKYESYADVTLGEWIHLKITVRGARAELHINGAPQPALIVTDLKLGAGLRGGVGFWIESGTIGYFRALRISEM